MRQVVDYSKNRLLPGTVYSGPSDIAIAAGSSKLQTMDVNQLALWRSVAIPEDLPIIEPYPLKSSFFSPIWSRHEKQVQIMPLHVEKDSHYKLPVRIFRYRSVNGTLELVNGSDRMEVWDLRVFCNGNYIQQFLHNLMVWTTDTAGMKFFLKRGRNLV